MTEPLDDARLCAVLIALAEHGIPADIQALLVHGSKAHHIPPGALAKALRAAPARGDAGSAKALRLLQASSCFRGDVCSLLPCACAETLAAALVPPPSEAGREDRYIPDIVKNAMLTMWNYICDDTKCHPLDIEHGKGKYLTFTPRHWAQMTGDMVAKNLADLSRSDPGTVAVASADRGTP